MKAANMLLARNVEVTRYGVNLTGAGVNAYDATSYPAKVSIYVFVLIEPEPNEIDGTWPGKIRLLDDDKVITEKKVKLVVQREVNGAFCQKYTFILPHEGNYRVELWRDESTVPLASAPFETALKK